MKNKFIDMLKKLYNTQLDQLIEISNLNFKYYKQLHANTL